MDPLTSYEVLIHLTEYHLCEIYGSYGTGKSRFVAHIALEAQRLGARVLFIDTEMGLPTEVAAQIKNYWYVGDSLDALEDAVAWAKDHRGDFDLLIVDSVGTPVYLNYIEFESMAEKLKAFQRLATVFRDMVRFARGERGVDFDPKSPLDSKRKALSIAVNHCLSEFSRVVKEEPESEPLAPFGGSIHRVPKVILRIEPAEMTAEKSVFNILTYKLRNLPKNLVVGRYTIDARGIRVDWNLKLLGLEGRVEARPKAAPSASEVLSMIPQDLAGEVEAHEEEGYVVLRLKRILKLEDFLRLLDAVRRIGGEYVSMPGKESYFRIPRLPTH